MKFELNKALFKVFVLAFLFADTICKTIEINDKDVNRLTLYQDFDEAINITRNPKTVYSGGSVFFLCTIIKTTSTLKNYTIQWTRNAQPLGSNGSQKITQESKATLASVSETLKRLYDIWLESTLSINIVNSDDQGEYCCYVTEGNEQCIIFSLTEDKSKAKSNSKDIYEASMIALACFMITIIGLFVLFLCNRSFFRRGSPTDGTERRPSDLFNVGAELAAMRHIDKPPTYEQVVSQDRVILGMPPPSYNDSGLAASIDSVRPRTQGHRLLTRSTAPYWPSDRDNSDPATIDVTSFNRITLIHPGRRGAVRYNGRPNRRRNEDHVELAGTNSDTQRATSIAGSVNSAFVSDA